MKHLEVVHGQLQDLSLLQLSAALFLAGCWDQPLEFREGGVDAISTLLLDDAAAPLPSHELARVSAGRPGDHK